MVHSMLCQFGVLTLNSFLLQLFLGLPDSIPSINKDGVIISFECRPVFSNVMDLKIAALNANPVPLHQVVMELEVPHVSCYLTVF